VRLRHGIATAVFIAATSLLLMRFLRTSEARVSTGPHPAAPRLRAHVEMLAGTIGERNLWHREALDRAADYIAAQLVESGYAPEAHPFDVSGTRVNNLDAVLRGTSRRDEIVVVGAHYDSVSGCPGANDNATGVAAVLELAHRLARTPASRTIRFAAFVNEEPPFFQTANMGSVVYANAAKARGDRIVGMLSLETMGYYSEEKGSQQYPAAVAMLYPDVGNFIALVANVGSARLLMDARRAFKSRTPFPVQSAAVPAAIPGVGWSDHWAFWQAGYAAMMVTDTAPFRYPWYHTANDTPDKIDYEKLAQVVDGLEAVIESLTR
jgi:Zn-dependent M28 family amino/carboxypeptidase